MKCQQFPKIGEALKKRDLDQFRNSRVDQQSQAAAVVLPIVLFISSFCYHLSDVIAQFSGWEHAVLPNTFSFFQAVTLNIRTIISWMCFHWIAIKAMGLEDFYGSKAESNPYWETLVEKGVSDVWTCLTWSHHRSISLSVVHADSLGLETKVFPNVTGDVRTGSGIFWSQKITQYAKQIFHH